MVSVIICPAIRISFLVAVHTKRQAVTQNMAQFRKSLEWFYVMSVQSSASLLTVSANELVAPENFRSPFTIFNATVTIPMALKICARFPASVCRQVRRLNSPCGSILAFVGAKLSAEMVALKPPFAFEALPKAAFGACFCCPVFGGPLEESGTTQNAMLLNIGASLLSPSLPILCAILL